MKKLIFTGVLSAAIVLLLAGPGTGESFARSMGKISVSSLRDTVPTKDTSRRKKDTMLLPQKDISFNKSVKN